MTDYIAIAETEDDPEAPITSSWGKRVRNNPVAITEGAAGAPRIQTAAIANGAVTAAKLATGTGERDWVLARIAAAAVGAVGTYAFLYNSGSATLPGETRPASQLRYSSAAGGSSSGEPSGTWRCMGIMNATNDETRTTLWLRVS